MIKSEDFSKIVENVLLNVPMEDAPGLIDKSFGEFVDEFLRCAEVIYKTLEVEDHKSQYCLIGNIISVAIRRLPYLEGTGKKGGTCEKERYKTETKIGGGIEISRDTANEEKSFGDEHPKTNGQDETVELTKEDQGEGEPAEECSCKSEAESEAKGCEKVEAEKPSNLRELIEKRQELKELERKLMEEEE